MSIFPTDYEINRAVERQLRPSIALITYKDSSNSDLYIESHKIDKQGRLLAGKPLTHKCIAALAESFSIDQSTTPHGKIPENMLFFDSRKAYEKYIWYNPPQKRQLYFDEKLAIENGEYHVPGIIYVVSGESLSLYAFAGKKPERKLYKAPFFNTSNGHVCLGNAKIHYPENPDFEAFISYWEKKFWLTAFTHLGGNQNPTRHNLVLVTKNSKEHFNNKELVPITTTLNDLLK